MFERKYIERKSEAICVITNAGYKVIEDSKIKKRITICPYFNVNLQKKRVHKFEIHKFFTKISTHLLTVLITCVILHAEQRKQHISPVGEIFLI